MKLLRPLCTLLFGMAVLLFFGLAYPHHLHYQEQFQLFLFDSSYVWEIVKLPGGVADLLGRFCTQFFLFAWVGALMIAILLSAVQFLTLRLCNSLTVAPSTEQKNNVQHSTFNVQCSTFNVQRSTFNVQRHCPPKREKYSITSSHVLNVSLPNSMGVAIGSGSLPGHRAPHPPCIR